MTQPPSRAISPLPEKTRTNSPKYRLLIEQSGYGNSLRGAVKRGDDAVYGWTANVLPADLTRFLASHYFYESTRRYFERFQQITDGAYPIVFRDADGVYAVSTVCTHLGCIVKAESGGFDCPCHGSRFALDGHVVKGPAPKALPWLAVTPVSADTFSIDMSATVPAGKKVTA